MPPSSRSSGRAAYEASGRTRQKHRTRAALLDQLRRLMAAGETPSVAAVAAAAGIARTTAYRYFPDQDALLRAAYPQIAETSLLGEHPPDGVAARVEIVVNAQLEIVRDWEPQLRAALWTSLNPNPGQPALRGGRAIGWFREALAPLGGSRPDIDRDEVAVRLRAAVGIEPYVWLVDVAGVRRGVALDIMRRNALAILGDALATGPPPTETTEHRHPAPA